VTGPETLYAVVDPDLFYQVVSNLVLNAFEAYSDRGLIKIALASKGSGIEITVANKGELPDPDQIEQIFEPYFTKKVRGTGLGLAVARRIVKAHGGTISASMDRRGGWLVIKIELPAAQKGDRGGSESSR
jgi:signal transduction histidine kinase